jgi:RimJ/RimL family protein N-acetyltransferase
MLKPLQLLTPRLVLRPATTRDTATLQRLWPQAAMARWIDAAPTPERGLWLMALAGPGDDVGAVALRPSAMVASRANDVAPIEVTVALWPERRGQGYAQEALKAVLWHAQSASAGRSFVAVCDVPNAAGDRMLRRLGFAAGYEADAGPWRARQYCLPLRSRLPAP